MENLVVDKISVKEDRNLYNSSVTDLETKISESNSNFSKDGDVKISFTENEFETNTEDSKEFLSQIFGRKDVILNEKWDISENLQAKVISCSESDVYVDCLIDVENRSFQQRVFPIYLFKNLTGLRKDKLVLIKTNMKAGSVRIDVFPGDGIVNEKYFNLKDKWKTLEDAGLDEKLTEW